MIKIEHTETYGWEAAIRGARNPMNSWDKSDSMWDESETDWEINTYLVGPNDHKLLVNLANAGPDHGKYLRMIMVWCDITAPLYWLKEMDTYRMGVEKNSCSTMHKIHAEEFKLDDFSIDHLYDDLDDEDDGYTVEVSIFESIVERLNGLRLLFNTTKLKMFWYKLIQLLPSSYNQRRTYMFSYAALRNMYHARKHHKLDEWREFCRWIESLPYSELITGVTTDA